MELIQQARSMRVKRMQAKWEQDGDSNNAWGVTIRTLVHNVLNGHTQPRTKIGDISQKWMLMEQVLLQRNLFVNPECEDERPLQMVSVIAALKQIWNNTIGGFRDRLMLFQG